MFYTQTEFDPSYAIPSNWPCIPSHQIKFTLTHPPRKVTPSIITYNIKQTVIYWIIILKIKTKNFLCSFMIFMPNYVYGLFWTWSPCLDLKWRSHSTGTIPELLITSIVWHKNKNRWTGGSLWRSCELFCVVIFHESEGRVKYHYTKQWYIIQFIAAIGRAFLRDLLCNN